ncbi:amidohydrolase [Mesorhizobium sp. WSM4976]|uniref:amidohydrolase n=1 Tax=Mesorhizobium sp. WSM4976 TaxID=3038549 RepID=UPI002415C758|nr:amidohydrolase [Mesorhizobium sp. WSM4976]MDG4898393.1 amidohydrolase [Mesorhizobium sp. WSM4976]
MEKHGLKGTIRFFGEPAENMCGGKVFHAAKGYYDGIDAAIAWRSSPLPALLNTCALDTLCGCFWSKVYTFEHEEVYGLSLRTLQAAPEAAATPQASARAPGALDALCLMYTTSKFLRDAMLPHTGSWALNEAILANATATADNLPPRFAQIQYSWRCPTIEMAERILAVLDGNAEQVARLTQTRWRSDWVSRTRPGLPNQALAEIAYANFERVGPPEWNEEAREFARACQRNLEIAPMQDPFVRGAGRMTPPKEAEAQIRATLPDWQTHYGADDYVEYTWHAPTVRILVARPRLASPQPGYVYPQWVGSALGGVPAVVDPVIFTAAKVIGSTIIDLLTSPDKLARCRDEFDRRTGGGIGGERWLAPLLDRNVPPPVHHPWPEYVTTARGPGWCLPTDT